MRRLAQPYHGGQRHLRRVWYLGQAPRRRDGQVLCVIDVAGQMNEIESEVAGEVAAIHRGNNAVVEVRETLMGVSARRG